MNLSSGATPKNLKPLSIRGRILAVIASKVASTATRTWLMRFPMTRWLVNRETERLFDLCGGFVYSQVLSAFVEADLVKGLSMGPAHIDDLACVAKLSPERLGRLLQAACSLGLTHSLGQGMYCLGIKGAALVDNPGVIAMIRHHAHLYQDLADPLTLLRDSGVTTRLSTFWSYLADDRVRAMTSDSTSTYSDLMAESQTMISEVICSSIKFNVYQKVLDIGGGKGVFADHIVESSPRTLVTVFDLPEVIRVFEQDGRKPDKSCRIDKIAGNFFEDAIPADYDLITLVRVLFDHSDENVLKLLTRIYKALNPRGTLMIAEPFSSEQGADRIADAYFNMYLLAMGDGQVRTFERHSELLRAAGFGSINLVRSVSPSLARIILAQP